MSIPASAQPTPITAPNAKSQFVDQNGILTASGRIALQELWSYVVNTSRTYPCNAATTSSGGTQTIKLTLLPVQPKITQYADYDTYAFVADANVTANLFAFVVVSSGTFATLPVYKANGTATAGSGDVSSGGQYFVTFTDSLNSGSGGFVLR